MVQSESSEANPITRLACVQFEPNIGDKLFNISKSSQLIATASEQGAKVIVLPELCNTGYMFDSPEQAVDLSETVPGGPTVTEWARLASKFDVYICAGIAEYEGGKLFNSSVLIGPRGYIGTYRKNHLWDKENLFFQPGDLGFPVFPTPIGNIGLLICYDCWFPEAWRSLSLLGADLVCVSTNWVPIPGQDPKREAMSNILCMAAAHCNGIYVAAADRVGIEKGQQFIGQSLICSHTGWPIGGPASVDSEEIIYADCDLKACRQARVFNDFNQVVQDRRPNDYLFQ